MRGIRQNTLVFVVLFLLITGCASEKKIPADNIRGRADRAFGELRSEETGSKAYPRQEKRAAIRPSVQSALEQGGAVRVQKGKRPDWVDGESAQYPSPLYLTGVGYDPDRKSAEDKARAEIAKIFLSKIDARTRSYQEYLQTTSKGRSQTEQAVTIEEITKVSTQKVLSGVRISQVYQETGQEPIFYALAVLDRGQSAQILRDKIHGLDRETERLFSSAKAEKDMLVTVKYLRQAIQSHILRGAYDAELRIVSQSGRGISPPIPFAEIKSKLESILLRDFLIGVSVTGTRAGEIQDALLQGLNQQGFSVSEDLTRAQVLVRGTVEIKPLDRGASEWKYVQWRTHFDMVDKEGGAVFGSVNKTGREGHLNLAQAENRAVRKMRKTLATEIAVKMKRYIFSQ
ncbi:MAG: LPP20 family lipoprotein [Deltaproteobacteria bacterium]|nr:LPP20 family lipoprotein [Deltaproteobacteria bacterium]